MKKTKLVPRLYTVADYEREEKFLASMSRRGWHFCRTRGLFLYQFQKGEPKNDVYKMDFTHNQEHGSDYQQLFQDAGWTVVYEAPEFTWFRADPASVSTTEIYTDTASKRHAMGKIARYSLRVLLVPVIASLITWYEWYFNGAAVSPALLAVLAFTFALVGYVNIKMQWLLAKLRRH